MVGGLPSLAYADQSDIHREMARQVSLPEDQIDVGIAALTFAKDIYPEIDVTAYSAKIDALAKQVKRLANGTTDPEQRIRTMNTVLYRVNGFHYDLTPFSRSKQEYYFLNGILDSRKGICYTLPLLYIAVAQRVGYPIYPVAAPDHMFLRYVDPSFKEQNIEATSGGKYFEDAWYIKDFSIGKRGLKSGAYLRTMTYRELLGEIVAANAFVLGSNGSGEKSLKYFETAIRLNPKCAECYMNLCDGYEAMSKVAKGDTARQFRAKSRQYALKAKQLGYVDPSIIELGRNSRGK